MGLNLGIRLKNFKQEIGLADINVKTLGGILDQIAMDNRNKLLPKSSNYPLCDIGVVARLYIGPSDIIKKYLGVGTLVPISSLPKWHAGVLSGGFNFWDKIRYSSVQLSNGLIVPKIVMEEEPSLEYHSYAFPKEGFNIALRGSTRYNFDNTELSSFRIAS